MSRPRLVAGLAAAGTAVIAASTIAVVGNRPSVDRTRPVAQASTPAPTLSTPTPSATPTPPVSRRLHIAKEYQSTSYNCAPASAVVSLSTFGIKARQSTLARKMYTKSPDGTTGAHLSITLREYLHSTPYLFTAGNWSVVTDDNVLKDTAYDVGVLRRAPMLAVWWDRLPWNKGRGTRRNVGHFIVAYGYDRSDKTITVFDPWPDTGGTHTLSALALTRALQPQGFYYLYT